MKKLLSLIYIFTLVGCAIVPAAVDEFDTVELTGTLKTDALADNGGGSVTSTARIVAPSLTVNTDAGGVTFGSGDDDKTLLLPNVTGTPSLGWDESGDSFSVNRGLNFSTDPAGGPTIEIGAGTDADWILATLTLNAEQHTIWWDDSEDLWNFQRGADFDGFLQFDEEATPATPTSGKGRLYFKSDGNVYSLNDAGTETNLTGAASGDMLAATYDPATISEQLVGLTATQTLTNKTVNDSSFEIDTGASLTLEEGGELRHFTSSTDAWTLSGTGLVDGSNFGTFLEGATNAHVVIGVHGNDIDDGLWVIKDDNADGTYDNTLLEVSSDDMKYLGDPVARIAANQLLSNKTIVGATFTNSMEIENFAANFDPIGDADLNFITVGVTGTPTISWDESRDTFNSNKGWDFVGDVESTEGFCLKGTIGGGAADTYAIMDDNGGLSHGRFQTYDSGNLRVRIIDSIELHDGSNTVFEFDRTDGIIYQTALDTDRVFLGAPNITGAPQLAWDESENTWEFRSTQAAGLEVQNGDFTLQDGTQTYHRTLDSTGGGISYWYNATGATILASLGAEAGQSGRLALQNSSGTTTFELHGDDGMSYTRRIETDTTTNIITASESGRIFRNTGAASILLQNLPAAAAGLEYTFYVDDADGMRIYANTGDTILVDGAESTGAGGTVEATQIGAFITLLAIDGSAWVATNVSSGDWLVDGDPTGFGSSGQYYFSTPASASLVAATPKLAAGTTTSIVADGFTVSSANRLTYDGMVTRNVSVEATFSVTKTGGGSTTGSFYIYKNGSAVTGVQVDRTLNNSGNELTIALHGIVSLATDDYVELWYATGNGNNMRIESGTVSAIAID